MCDIGLSSPDVSKDGAAAFVGSFDRKAYAIDTANPSTICDNKSSPFSVDGTVLVCVRNDIESSSGVSHCVFEKTWEQLIGSMHGLYHTDGLGKLMTVKQYEVSVCISIREHPCVQDENDMACFTYSEMDNMFVSWQFNSVVRAVKR
jgi:hypothetical protein